MGVAKVHSDIYYDLRQRGNESDYEKIHVCAYVCVTHVHTGKELKTQAFREEESGQRNCVITNKEKRQAVWKRLKTRNYYVKKGKRKSTMEWS